MANTNKTKAEILQELESIKGLLLEEDDIPILQDMEDEDEILDDELHSEPPVLITRHESVLPGQGSLFDEPKSAAAKIAQQLNASTSAAQELKRTGFAASQNNTSINPFADNRPLAKASGENPFLPQHIRERLHGNNPPPLFEYETAKKIISSTKNIAHKTNKPRQYLVEEVMLSMMPQIERELRHRLFSMSVEDLEKLLNEEED
ncbi:MAG: hypothetical protein K0Q78_1254 [Cellvibrio sp.]|jgi:hypothetical protein|nr:hypothetical protein [Cellvibrio sp.]